MPRGVYERKPKEEPVHTVESIREAVKTLKEDSIPNDGKVYRGEPIRRYSDIRDAKGPNHPLCMKCGHREDMHHTWSVTKVIEPLNVWDQKGKRQIVRERIEKTPVYGQGSPCQHACNCGEYE